VSEQLALLPLKALRIWDPGSRTVSRPRMAKCEDGLDYCIKYDLDGKLIRANEWIGTSLANSVGIAVAPAKIVEDLDRKILFGSQIYGNDVNDNFGVFIQGGLSADHLRHIWRTFALDLFLRNIDRHLNQFKIFEQNGSSRIISFDFGESLFNYWPTLDLPLPAASRTISTMRAISQRYGPPHLDLMDEVLNRLDQIEGATMVRVINSLPRGWVNAKLASDFLRWFGGRPRRNRIAQIREGVRDGTYL
jgi:hypothetical protein